MRPSSPILSTQLWSISAAGQWLPAKCGVLFVSLGLLFQTSPLITVVKLPWGSWRPQSSEKDQLSKAGKRVSCLAVFWSCSVSSWEVSHKTFVSSLYSPFLPKSLLSQISREPRNTGGKPHGDKQRKRALARVLCTSHLCPLLCHPTSLGLGPVSGKTKIGRATSLWESCEILKAEHSRLYIWTKTCH